MESRTVALYLHVIFAYIRSTFTPGLRTLGDTNCDDASPRSYNIAQTFGRRECMM